MQVSDAQALEARRLILTAEVLASLCHARWPQLAQEVRCEDQLAGSISSAQDWARAQPAVPTSEAADVGLYIYRVVDQSAEHAGEQALADGAASLRARAAGPPGAVGGEGGLTSSLPAPPGRCRHRIHVHAARGATAAAAIYVHCGTVPC